LTSAWPLQQGIAAAGVGPLSSRASSMARWSRRCTSVLRMHLCGDRVQEGGDGRVSNGLVLAMGRAGHLGSLAAPTLASAWAEAWSRLRHRGLRVGHPLWLLCRLSSSDPELFR
jgi:hypothetical protein